MQNARLLSQQPRDMCLRLLLLLFLLVQMVLQLLCCVKLPSAIDLGVEQAGPACRVLLVGNVTAVPLHEHYFGCGSGPEIRQ